MAFIFSIFLYIFKQQNVSNFIKIIFNIGGLLIYLPQISNYAIQLNITLGQCKAIVYVILFGQIIHRSSLSALLYWRLMNVKENKNIIDNWVCNCLFVARIAFHVSILYPLCFCDQFIYWLSLISFLKTSLLSFV